MTRVTSILHEDQCTFFIISLSVFLRMRNISNKYCRGNENTNFVFNYFFFESRAIYEIMWKCIVEPGRPQVILWCMRIACCTPKVTSTHSECLIRIVFAPQQSLHERASMLHYTYIACLVKSHHIQTPPAITQFQMEGTSKN